MTPLNLRSKRPRVDSTTSRDEADDANESLNSYERQATDTGEATTEASESSDGFGFVLGGLGSKVLLASVAFLGASVGIGLFSKAARSTFDLVETRINIIDQARTSFILAGDSLSIAEQRSVDFANSLRFDTLSSIREVSGETRFLFQQVLTSPEQSAVEELALQLDRAGVSSRGAALEFATLLQASTPTEQQFNDIALQLGILPERLRELTQDGIVPFIAYLTEVNSTQSAYQQSIFLLDDALDELNQTLGSFGEELFTPFITGFANIVDSLVTTEEEAGETGGGLQNIFGWNYTVGRSWKSSIEEVDTDLQTLLDQATTVQDKLDIVFGRTRESTNPVIGPIDRRDRDEADSLSIREGLFAFPLANQNNRIPVTRHQTDPLGGIGLDRPIPAVQDLIDQFRRLDEIGERLNERDLPLGTSPSSETGVATPVEIKLDEETVGRFVVRTMDGVVRQVPRAL